MSNPGLGFEIADAQAAHGFAHQIIEFVGIGAATNPREPFASVDCATVCVFLDEGLIPRFLLTACVGLYGTMSYSVARQVGEIGIRMALGAQRGAVVWMVLRRVLLLAAVGLAISVPAALSASQLVKSFLFETQPNDPGTLALAGVVLLSAAILAGYAPARRASRIDPLAALRHD